MFKVAGPILRLPCLLIPFLILVLGVRGVAAQAVLPVERPNFLVLVADDLGYFDLGFMGNDAVRTPNLDRFFSENAAFFRHYVDGSCQPTRAVLMTGLFPADVGFSSVGVALPDGVPTTPERLAALGYHTEHIGKWHLGWAIPEAMPRARGFDEFFGFLDQGFLAGPGAGGEWRHRVPTYRNPWLITNDSAPRRHEGHLTDLVTDRVIERLAELAAAPEPWYMNVWFYSPHDPLEPAERFIEDDTPAGLYRALLAQLDDAVGRILAAVDEAGAAERTIVIFMSDNGGTNNHTENNYPLRGNKVGFQEGAVRAPMAIRIPGAPAPLRIDQPVSYLDFLPTILDLAGAEPDPGLPGRSMLPLFTGRPLPDQPLFWEAASAVGYAFGVMSAGGRWRYGEDLFAGTAVLHDIAADPYGRVNLVDDPDHAAVLDALFADYRAWHEEIRVLFEGRPAGEPDVLDTRGVQRTPGFNSVTWTFAVDAGALPLAPVRVAGQEGVADVRVGAAAVVVKLFDGVLVAPLRRAGAGRCRTVTLTTQSAYPGMLRGDYEFEAVLYVDDTPVASLQREDRVAAGHEHLLPLVIHPAAGAVLGYRVRTEFVFPVDGLRTPGVTRAIDGLCPQGAG